MPVFSNQYLSEAFSEPASSRSGEVASRWLIERAKLLDDKERALVMLCLEGASRTSAGRAFGISSGTACRRLQRAMNRIRNPIVGAILDPHCELPHEHRVIGIEHFLQGRPARHIADRHQMNERHVRMIIQVIKVWHDGPAASRGRRSASRPTSLQKQNI